MPQFILFKVYEKVITCLSSCCEYVILRAYLHASVDFVNVLRSLHMSTRSVRTLEYHTTYFLCYTTWFLGYTICFLGSTDQIYLETLDIVIISRNPWSLISIITDIQGI